MRLRRALLFMPGDDRHKIEKGAGLEVDSVIMDLEDGVAFSQKAAARQVIHAALQEIDFGTRERLVRINPVSTPLWEDDLRSTLTGRPDGYMLPKTEDAEQVRRVDAIITAAEREHGWPEGGIALITLVETARGILNLREIAASVPRLVALAFGAEDYAGDIEARRTPDGWEVFYARSALVLHAKAHGLQAIDTPFVSITAEDSQLIAEAQQVQYMGYTGKLVIHPRQIAPVQSVFVPSAEQIRKAKALVDTHNAHQVEGRGVFVMDGNMVDMPVIRAAETVLARARAAGIDPDGIDPDAV